MCFLLCEFLVSKYYFLLLINKINMEIRIIDNSGINHFLDFDLKKANKKMEFHLLTSFIKECFKEQVQKIHDLIPFENELVIKVHLEQELQSDT